jgi:hypothetical protein
VEQLTFTGDDTAMATLLLSVMGALRSSNVPLSANGNAKGSSWRRNAAPTAAVGGPSAKSKRPHCVSGPTRVPRRQHLARELGISRETVYQYLRTTQ